MTLNPNPTPGGYPFAHNDDDGSLSLQQKVAETQDTLDGIKNLIEKLQSQLDGLMGFQED